MRSPLKFVAALEQIEELFSKHTQRHHFHLVDLREGGGTHTIGERADYPIASCSKLAVLITLFDTLTTQEDLHVPITLQDTSSVATSMLSMLAPPVVMTRLQLAQLMLCVSDATATDVLIAELGFERINETLRRFAPDSAIDTDIAGMVKHVMKHPECRDAKRVVWTPDALARFQASIASCAHTNAVDLASLALGAWRYKPEPYGQHDYELCLETPRFFPRGDTYLAHRYRIFSKGGSLIGLFFLNDCGVVLDTVTKSSIAAYGYCAAGVQLPTMDGESLTGLIGLKILDALGLNSQPNYRWSPIIEERFERPTILTEEQTAVTTAHANH